MAPLDREHVLIEIWHMTQIEPSEEIRGKSLHWLRAYRDLLAADVVYLDHEGVIRLRPKAFKDLKASQILQAAVVLPEAAKSEGL